MASEARVVVIYDGECVFCANFARLLRLRENFGAVRLINARNDDDPRVAEARRHARLNDAFVVIADDRWLIGPEAMNFLALASDERGWLPVLMRPIFRSPRIARVLYPALVRLRKIGLWLMGRKELAY
ncbi:DCC1-like thiol-disulfide oxidoreductase family protein [Terrarubrum flagellatum]|uniref:DCC1-like thiol-disulfide oxidoreductase family protein n=1 Tax=Terrirubrum flagellatum TaxID=2895980 RepID=UPI0031450CCF